MRVMTRPPFNGHPYRRSVLSEEITEALMDQWLRNAGFLVAKLAVRETVRTYQTPEEMIRFSEASSFGNLLGHLPPDLKPLAREQLASELGSVARTGGLGDVRRGLIAIGIKP